MNEEWLKEAERLMIHLENAGYSCGSAHTGPQITKAHDGLVTARVALLAHLAQRTSEALPEPAETPWNLPARRGFPQAPRFAASTQAQPMPEGVKTVDGGQR